MNTREYSSYKRMAKMTVRFLENHDSKPDSNLASTEIRPTTRTSILTATSEPETTLPSRIRQSEPNDKMQSISKLATKKDTTENPEPTESTKTEALLKSIYENEQQSEIGRYANWTSKHTTLAALPWCCIGDLMAFCDKYEYRSLNRNEPQTHNRIVTEVKALLNGQAPFDMRKRFPGDIRSPENLWVCIGRCTGVEYHLNRILSAFRRPIDKLAAEKQRMVRHDFHLAVNELRLDISARISDVRLYDRNVFEREFHLEWQDGPQTD